TSWIGHAEHGWVQLVNNKLELRCYSWIEHYERELRNFEEFGDEGEVWFGRVAENRLVKYVSGSEQLSKSSKLIDFGCGNGSLLRTLRQKGYSHLCGVDYSEEAISLAKKLAERECPKNNIHQIDFQVVDLINENINLGKFDAVFDKGTWDALSLSVDRECRLRKYRTNVCRTLRPSGLFIICSCNYSRNELESYFGDEELGFLEEIPSKNIIEFGGRNGSTTTCVIFRKL
uniref:Protein-lysine N-methyltransferase n=1 Tax=Onchocerca volvulus TaxID=6282 RepID=A0A8R1U1W3_ONCVO